MKKFNYPTTLFYGEGALEAMGDQLSDFAGQKPLLVADPGLSKAGIVAKVESVLKSRNQSYAVFDQVDGNPTEDNVLAGAKVYNSEKCDSIIALGGGSPMDAAKVIAIKALHDDDLEVFDDLKGGAEKVVHPLPPIIAIPTTAGTGSEVGRCAVITLKKNNVKTIIFHPTLMPKLAVLDPALTVGLPAPITAATGIDAFTHCLEAYFAPGFDPMGDGIALEGMQLVLKSLPQVYREGSNIDARGRMLMAATMGATAFQKGLGMIHSLAHPLSAICHLHHGLANALMGPESIKFLEKSELDGQQRSRIQKVHSLFKNAGFEKETLSESINEFYRSLGIEFGLVNHGVQEDQLKKIAEDAFADVCHQTNMIPVQEDDLFNVLTKAFN